MTIITAGIQKSFSLNSHGTTLGTLGF